jgi:hypothetical protein
MWIRRKYYNRRCTKFFRLNLNHDNLSNYFQTNFALMQHHKYSLTELDNLMPWERQVYIDLLMNYLEEENAKIKEQQRNRK